MSRGTRATALVACGAMLVSGLMLVSSKAIAAVLIPESAPGLISLWTDTYPLEFPDLDAGESAFVRLTVQLDHTDHGDLTLEVRKFGDMATTAGGLELSVERCAVEWTAVPTGVVASGDPVCASGRTTLLSAGPSDDFTTSSPRWDLGVITDEDAVFLLVTLALPDTLPAGSFDTMDAAFGFGLFAEGLPVAASVTPTGSLAFTGMDALSLLLVAAGAIGTGVVVTRMRARREES